MAESENTYVAWDGVLYEGSPPAGWYLATDNRWWPPQEIIEGDPYADEDPYATDLDDPYGTSNGVPDDGMYSPTLDEPSGSPYDEYDNSQGDPFGGPPAHGSPTHGSRAQQPAPPDSWAPKSAGELPPPRSELPPNPTGNRGPGPPRGPRQGQRNRSGGRRSGGFRPGFLIPFLIFGLFRCGDQINSSTEFPDFGEPTVDFGEEFESAEEFFEGQTQVRVRGDFIDVDSDIPFYIEFQQCGPDTIPMYLVNDGESGAFTVDLRFQPLGTPDGETIGEPFTLSWNGGLGTNEFVEPELVIPDDQLPITDCLLIDATVNRS